MLINSVLNLLCCGFLLDPALFQEGSGCSLGHQPPAPEEV